MQKRFKILSQIFILFFLTVQVEAVNIKLLKGTVLPDMDPAYAPFWGLVMWEEKIAEQFYRLSAKQMLKRAEVALADAKPEQVLEKAEVLKILGDQKNTATEDLVAQMFNEAGGTFNVTNADNNPVKQLKPEHIGTILKMISDPKVNAEALKNYLATLNFLKPSGSKYSSKDFKPFVDALLGAVQECSTSNSDQIYPENTAQEVVLGYVLAKSNTRQDLQDYLSAFTGKSVVLLDEDYTAQDFAKILSSVPNLTKVDQFSDFVCATVYQQKYASLLPKIVANKSVNYQNQIFSDCVETTIRNLCNIATYNSKEQKLGKNPQGVVMSSQLQKFYNQDGLYQNPVEVSHTNVHQAWVNLVENIPGVIYNRLLVPGTKNFIEARNFCDGVIPIATDDETLPVKSVDIAGTAYQVRVKIINGKTYWLVPAKSGLSCYELMPTASNIIVTLNNLFDLKLYNSVDDILQPDFAQKYFKAMCENLDWSITEDQMQKVVDFEQGKSGSVAIDLSVTGGAKFKINLMTKAHGFVSVDSAVNQQNLISQKDLMQADGKIQAACVALGVVKDENLKKLNSMSMKYQLILNPDQRLQIIKVLINDSKLLSTLEPYVVKLIMSMSEFSDPHYQVVIFDNFLKFTTISKPIAQALIMMTTMGHLKYNFPKTGILCTKILLNDVNQSKYIDELLRLDDPRAFFNIQRFITAKLLTSESVNSLWSWIDERIRSRDGSVPSNVLVITQDLITAKLLTSEHVNSLWSWIDERIRSSDDSVPKDVLRIIQDLITAKLLTSEDVDSLWSWIYERISSSNGSVPKDVLRIIQDLITAKLLTSEHVNSLWSWINEWIRSYGFVSNDVLVIIQDLITAKLLTSEDVDSLLSWIDIKMSRDQAYHSRNSLVIIRDLIRAELLTSENVKSLSSLIDLGIQSDEVAAINNALAVIQDLISAKLLTSENVKSLWSLIDMWMQSDNRNVQNSTLEVIRDLITAKLFTLKNIDSVKPLLEKAGLSKSSYVTGLSEGIQKQLKELDLVKNDENSEDSEWHIIEKSEIPELPVEQPKEQPKKSTWTDRISKAWHSLRGQPKSNENQLTLERERQLALLERQRQEELLHQEHVDPNRGEPGEGEGVVR